MWRFTILILLLTVPVAGQTFVPNGDFFDPGTAWTNTRMTDPAGAAGFAVGPTTALGKSKAIYMDFQTLTPVFYGNFVSDPFAIPAGTWDVTFDIAWEKSVTTPIPSPSVNRVELWIQDNLSTTVFNTGYIQVPNQTGLVERISYKGTVTIPPPGATPPLYTIEVQARHSNLAGMPYRVWIDNVHVGKADWFTYGLSCPGTGGFEPLIQAKGTPQIGTNAFTLRLERAMAPAPVFVVIGHNTAAWSGLPLPFAIGGGCSLNTGMTLWWPITPATGSGPGTGTTSLALAIPNNPQLTGVQLYSQFLVIDHGSGSWAGLTATEGLAFTIQ